MILFFVRIVETHFPSCFNTLFISLDAVKGEGRVCITNIAEIPSTDSLVIGSFNAFPLTARTFGLFFFNIFRNLNEISRPIHNSHPT